MVPLRHSRRLAVFLVAMPLEGSPAAAGRGRRNVRERDSDDSLWHISPRAGYRTSRCGYCLSAILANRREARQKALSR